MRYGRHIICSTYVQSSVLPRLVEGVRRRGECLVWRGAPDADGYARMNLVAADGTRLTARAHRVVVALFYDLGEQEVDHECRNRMCVNVAHLRVVSGLANKRLIRRRFVEDAGQASFFED